MIEQRKWPPVLKFGPKGKPENLKMHLLKNGFVAMDHDPPGMAIKLKNTKEDFRIPDDLSIETVDDSNALRECLSTFSLFSFEMFEVLIKSPSLKLYMGKMDGQVVGASMLFLSAGVAGLYHVQVHPERRKGIGTALTLVPMHDARKAGYEISVLQGSKMGEPVYRKIGFERYFEYNYCHPKGCSFSDFMSS